MKLIRIALLATVTASLFASAPARADGPINLSLVTPISILKETEAVTAFRFNLLYGKNTSVTGLDLGLVNHTTSGMGKGLTWGMVNLGEGSYKGAQLGTVNYTTGDVEGLQWGFVNYSANTNGLQLGFVNYAQKLHGVQIGLINIIKTDGQFPVFPIVNWSF